jgi:tetratricopeptide (TPR) repeat protein
MDQLTTSLSCLGFDDQHAKLYLNNPTDSSLYVVFGVKGTKPGKFAFFKTFMLLKVNILFIAPDGDNWYQNGIPTFGDNIEKVCSRLDELINILIEKFNFREVRLFGSSMGGYLSLFYISYSRLETPLNALVMGAETKLKLPYSQSLACPFNVDDEYKDIRFLDFKNRKVDMFAGEFDLIDTYSALCMKNIPGFKVHTHMYSGHVFPRTIEDTIGMNSFLTDFFNGSKYFIGTGHLSQYLNANDLEPLIHTTQFSKEYIDCIKSCLRKYSGFGWAWNRLGVYLHNQGKLEEAKNALQKSLLIHANNANTIEHLDVINKKMNNIS